MEHPSLQEVLQDIERQLYYNTAIIGQRQKAMKVYERLVGEIAAALQKEREAANAPKKNEPAGNKSK